MPDASTPAPTPSLGRRWLLDPIVRQLTQGVTPQKIALTLAVGSALALFPVLGTTTLLCFLAGIIFRLNQPIIQSVNGICTLVYFPLLLVLVHLGDTLVGAQHSSLDVRFMISLFGRDPAEFFRRFGVTGLHALLGWSVVAPFWVLLVYLLALFPLRAAARRTARS